MPRFEFPQWCCGEYSDSSSAHPVAECMQSDDGGPQDTYIGGLKYHWMLLQRENEDIAQDLVVHDFDFDFDSAGMFTTQPPNPYAPLPVRASS